MSWIRYQFYRIKLGIISSVDQGLRGLSKGSALSLPVKASLKRFAYRVQETSQKLCTSASRVPRSSAGIYCSKRGAPIRWINKAIPLTVRSSHENEGGTAAMELSEFHVLKKSGVESSPCTVGRQIPSIFYFEWNEFSNLTRKSSEKDIFESFTFFF